MRPVKRYSQIMEHGRLADLVADLDWYALMTVPQKEFVAQEILTQKGIVTYVPVERKWRRKNRFTKNKDLYSYPIVTRFVFVGFIPGVPCWYDMFKLPIITSCVGINGHPVKLDAKAMAGIISAYPNGMLRPTDEQYRRTHAEFRAGTLARICEGPFEGMVVPVQEIAGSEAKVVLELFGGIQEISISTWKLEAAA